MVPANCLGKVSSIDSGKAKETTMGKKMEINQFATLMAAVAVALPRDIDATTAQGWIDNPKSLQKALRDALVPKVKRSAMGKSEPTLLTPVDTTAFTRFTIRDNFKMGSGVWFHSFCLDFKEWFLDKAEVVKQNLCYHTLNRGSWDTLIIAELGGEAKAETSLAEAFALLLSQPNGEAGPLMTSGGSNVFYVRDVNGILRAVDFSWCGDGWGVRAYSVDGPNGWCAGSQIFSRAP